MTCNVLMGTLNPTHSLTHSLTHPPNTLALQRQVWLIALADERVGVQVKLRWIHGYTNKHTVMVITSYRCIHLNVRVYSSCMYVFDCSVP